MWRKYAKSAQNLYFANFLARNTNFFGKQYKLECSANVFCTQHSCFVGQYYCFSWQYKVHSKNSVAIFQGWVFVKPSPRTACCCLSKICFNLNKIGFRPFSRQRQTSQICFRLFQLIYSKPEKVCQKLRKCAKS